MTRPLISLVVSGALISGLFPPRVLDAQEPDTVQEPITTVTVDQLARTIRAEIEVIRWNMGRPIEVRSPIPVRDVTIRENFRQALTLWQKVNELAVDLVGGGEAPPVVPPPPEGEYGPPEVHRVLTSVLDRLQEIKDGTAIVSQAGLGREAPAVRPNPAAQPTDVFRSIVQSNRQVNRMLERAAQPSDVYRQVQQAVFYASEVLAAQGDENPYPSPPAFEPGLRPGDVYGRLLQVFDRLSASFDALGLDMVTWAGGIYEVDTSLSPGDVFDLATLLLSEVEYLHSRTPGARAPIQAVDPGLRWPSDVYQQAGILNEQAARILMQARKNADMVGIR